MTSSPAHLEANARYNRTTKGRATQRRADASRSRRRVERHAERIIRAKSGGCVDCGSVDDLHFHHRDPSTKRYTVAVMTNASAATFAAEIAKCDVVCQPCHIERHRR